MIVNTQRRIVNVWYILTLVFLISIFMPSQLGIDGMDGGFAISFLAGFMVIIGLIVIFIYRSRAKQLDEILSGHGTIVLWKYASEDWLRFVAADFEADKKLKRNLFITVVIISVLVGIMLLFVYQDAIVLFIILGIIVIVAIPALWAPYYRLRKLQNSEAEVLIAEKGVIVGEMFHLWIGLGASLDNVELSTDIDPSIITFHYSMPTRTGRQSEEARVPVPRGRIDEAIRIVNHFNSIIS